MWIRLEERIDVQVGCGVGGCFIDFKGYELGLEEEHDNDDLSLSRLLLPPPPPTPLPPPLSRQFHS